MKNRKGFILGFSFIFICLLGITINIFFKDSYAITVGVDKSGISTSTFKANVTNSTKVNYIKSAYESLNQLHTSINEF